MVGSQQVIRRTSSKSTRQAIWRLILATVASVLVIMPGASQASTGNRGYFVSNGLFWSFDTTLGIVMSMGGLNGLTAGDTIVGLDFRPQNGFLYGLGYNSGTGTVRLYAISVRSSPAVATPIGPTGTFVAADGSTPVPIAGTQFGFDFNPVEDRIRVVNDAGQNFRIDPNTGAFVDGDLGGAPGSVPGVNMDGPISGATSSLTAAAYTNNQLSAFATTLYTLSASTHTLYIQAPPDSGLQTSAIPVTLNGSPFNFTGASDLDILPGVNVDTNNARATGSAYALLTVGSTNSLYTIDLSSGAATLVGTLGSGMDIRNMALRGEPVSGGIPSVALTTLPSSFQNLIWIDTTGRNGSGTTVTGRVAGETLMAIAWRPATGQLFALGFNAPNGTGSATLYRLDPHTGAATVINSANSIADGAGSPISLAGATSFGFAFNPSDDRIRVVTDNGLNFRINPNDGTVVGGALDPPITGLPPGSTGVTGAAYTNRFAGATATTLYTLDPTSNMLFIQNPDNGAETAVVPITLNGAPFDFSTMVGFDIPPNVTVQTSGAAATGTAFAVLGTTPSLFEGNFLYSIDLSTGAATRLGLIAAQRATSVAVGDGPLTPPAAMTLTSSQNPATVSQSVTFTATLTAASSSGWFIEFRSNGTTLCGRTPLFGTTVATCTTSFPTAGTYQVEALYSGDPNHAGVTVGVSQVVIGGPTATTVSAWPNSVIFGQPISLIGAVSPSGGTGTVTFAIDGNALTPLAFHGSWVQTTVPGLTPGLHQVTATYSGDGVFARSTSAPMTVTVTEGAGALTQYFAEGATGGFFQTDIGVVNASDTDTAHVTATLYPEIGDPVVQSFTLPPLTRRSIDVNTTLGSGQGVSALLESDTPIAAMRQMTWGHPVYGSTLESGIPSPALTWYFAEGATNVMDLFYQVENPGSVDAHVTLTHLLEGGGAPVIEPEVVPAHTRRTFFINDVPGLRYAALSTVITSDQPIVAEHALYLNSDAHVFEGGSAGRGATLLSTSWSFAEGATGFYHTYLLLGNPNTNTATVAVTYRLPDGTLINKSYDVPGQSRRTVDVAGEDPQLASASFGMTLTSTLPIVSERSIWWGLPFYEGTTSLGSTSPGLLWAIGEGAEAGPNGEATFVEIANAVGTQGLVRLTVVYDDGTREQKDYTLLANARLTVRIGDDFAASVGKRFSVLVESLNVSVPITVDVSRFQTTTSFLDGGGAASATRIK